MTAPEQGCSRATAHMLAQSEDVQWLLLAHLGMKVGLTNIVGMGADRLLPQQLAAAAHMLQVYFAIRITASSPPRGGPLIHQATSVKPSLAISTGAPSGTAGLLNMPPVQAWQALLHLQVLAGGCCAAT